MQIEIVLLFSFPIRMSFILFLPSPELLVQWQVEVARADILACSRSWGWLWSFHRCPLSGWGSSLLFLHLFKWSYFPPFFLYYCLFISWFSDVRPTLCSWDKFYLVMVYSIFHMLLNLVCWHVRIFTSIFISSIGF